MSGLMAFAYLTVDTVPVPVLVSAGVQTIQSEFIAQSH